MSKSRVIRTLYTSPTSLNIGDNKVYSNDGTVQFINSATTDLVNIQAAKVNSYEVTGINTGTTVLDDSLLSLSDAIRYDYVIIKGANLRAGSFMAVWDSSNIEYAEYSTKDIGDTSDISLSCAINGSNMEFKATSISDGWVIKFNKFLI